MYIAANYHTSRDFFRHNPRFKLHAVAGGALFVDAPATRRTRIGATCEPDPLAAGEFSLNQLTTRLVDEGLTPGAWVNLCHLDNWSLPADALCQNAYGDLDYSSICPATSDTLDFATSLIADVAAAGVGEILVEATTFQPLVHGYHHERWLGDLSELTQFLLSLCFCRSCSEGIEQRGGMPVRARTAVRAAVEQMTDDSPAGATTLATSSAPTTLALDDVAAVLGDDLAPINEHRLSAVAALRHTVVRAAEAAGVGICFVDPSGAMKGYTTGKATGVPGLVPSWVIGSAPASLTSGHATPGLLAYSDRPDRVRSELAAYARDLDLARATVVLRPSAPDCSDPATLEENVASCRQAGVERVAFYHYAFLPLLSLDWIRRALEA